MNPKFWTSHVHFHELLYNKRMDESPKNNSNTSLPKILLVVFVVVIIAVAVGVFVVQKLAPDAPAIVNGEEISKEAYEARLASQEYYYSEDFYIERFGKEPNKDLVADLPRATLENLIQETLLAQYLSKKGIYVTDEEVQTFIQTEIIDALWEGDRERYEQDLRETFKTDIRTITHAVRRNLLIQKVQEAEDLSGLEFSGWYADLRESADVTINPK